MKYKLLLISLLTCVNSLIALTAYSQFIDYGQNPPGLHWQQINTPHIQLIFPTGFDKEGLRMAGVLEKIYSFENHSLQVSTKPISVILQNQQVESNGFVLLAPRRSEFFTSPAQDMEPTDWLNSLAVHEMRHVVQEDKVFGGKKIQLFESVQLGVFGLVFPSWFFEGDAVGMETALTATGRGRLPSFEREFRTNLLSGKDYSYSKYYLGSLKDNVPDYYRLGYFMVTKIRRDYGDSVFNLIYRNALRLTPWPLSASLKKYTGYTTPQFYKQTMAELRKDWVFQDKEKKPAFYRELNQRHDSVYSNYLLPHPYQNGQLICLKTGPDKTDAFYVVDTLRHTEKKLFKIGHQLVSHFDLAGNELIWDEERNDPRYAYRTYSVIMHYNLLSKFREQLTRRSRLFAPSLTADGTRFIAVSTDLSNQICLGIYSTADGSLIKRLPNPENYFFQTPRFDKSGKKIVTVAVNNRGKAIYTYNLDSNTHRLINDFTFTDISRPCFNDEQNIIYVSAADGVDDIFELGFQTGHAQQLTNSKFGANNPIEKSGIIYFNQFSLRGQNLSAINRQRQFDKTLSTKSDFIAYYAPLVKREAGGSIFKEQRGTAANELKFVADSLLIAETDTVQNKTTYQQKPYHEIDHFFYFHSLLPDVQGANLNSTSFLAGVRVLSTNKLNTTQTYAGIYYKNGANSAVYQAGFTYKRYYPYITANFINSRRYSEASGKDKSGHITYYPFSYREARYNFGLQIPLNFTIGNQALSIVPQINTSYIRNGDPSIQLSTFNRTLAFPMHYSVYLSRNTLMASRDLYPLWGQNADLEFENLPFTTIEKGRLFYMNSLFYLPGLFNHHSFQAGFSYQQNIGVYQNDRLINEISGYAFLPPNKLKNSFFLNYYLPLAYPDLQISSLAYVRKIQAGLFLNKQNLGSSTDPLLKSHQSFGLDIRVDCNLLRYYLPVFQIGTRAIILENNFRSPKFQLVLNYTI